MEHTDTIRNINIPAISCISKHLNSGLSFSDPNVFFVCFREFLRKEFLGQDGQDVSSFSLHQYLANRRNVVPCFVSPIG